MDTNDPGKIIANYADESMFLAEPITETSPLVTVISMHHDPLGTIAQKAMTYQGKFPRSLEDISDEDRMYYLQDVRKNVLGSPMEAVNVEFLIEGVTRGFTHQLVRQRVGAAYQQESMRFAVKDDFPVALPPSIEEVPGQTARMKDFMDKMDWDGDNPAQRDRARATIVSQSSNEERMRDEWDRAIRDLSESYRKLIKMGMPAEDARGLAPTNILTKTNYTSSLRGLFDHSGMRLCTQAQYEWRMVWKEMILAIREFGKGLTYRTKDVSSIPAGAIYSEVGDHNGDLAYEVSSEWQWNLIADMFKPICFKTGKCEFMSDFDRFCTIREQVQANADIGRPSSEWHKDRKEVTEHDSSVFLSIPRIRDSQWLDPKAAIQKTTDWRSEENKRNIEGRR